MKRALCGALALLAQVAVADGPTRLFLFDLGLSREQITNMELIIKQRPYSLCAKVVDLAMKGDRDSEKLIQSNPDFCLSFYQRNWNEY